MTVGVNNVAQNEHLRAVEQSTIRKILIRIVPFMALMFFINYLDRIAISFAGPNGMNTDLKLSATEFGFASGIFSLGYILLEVPSNLALNRFGARRWLARIMVSWGIVSFVLAFVQNFTELALLRLLLGVAEAGFFPGAVLFLSRWAPSRHRAMVLALFYVAQPLTNVLGGPLAGGLIQVHAFGLAGWRLMSICVALPAIIVGVVAWFYLDDKPSNAKWLTQEEQLWLQAELDTEQINTNSQAMSKQSVWAALGSARVWMLAIVYFGITYGFYVVAYFLPTIITGFEKLYGFQATNPFQQGMLSGAVYLPSAIVLLIWTRDARKRGVRIWHIWIPALVGVVGNIGALVAGSAALTLIFVALIPIAIFSANPNFWTLPSRFLSGAAAAAGIGLINTVGNIGGFAAPYVTGVLSDATGSFKIPLLIPGLLMLVSALFVVLFGLSQRRAMAGDTAKHTANVIT